MTSVLIQFLGRIESAPVFSYELAKGLLSNNIDVCAILHKEVENRDKWINLLGEDNICFVSQYISKKKIITSSIKFYEEWNNIKNKFRNKEFDYIICMDSMNLRNLNRIIGGDTLGKVDRLMSFAGKNADVADPWYTGDFDVTYRDIAQGLKGLLEKIL